MRNLLVAASLMLLACTVGVSGSLQGIQEQLAGFKPQSAIKFSHLNSKSHVFGVQQSSLLTPASDAPVCQEAAFTTLLISIYTQCIAQVTPLQNSTLLPTVEAHRAAWGVYCSSQCYQSIKTQVIGSKYWICLQPLIQFGALDSSYLCGNKDSNGDFCGLTMSRVQFTGYCSSSLSSATCGAIGNATCAWTGTYCTVNPTQTLLSSICGTCLSGLNTQVNSLYPGLSDAVGTITGTKSLCSQAPSGAYCLPLLASSASSLSTLFVSNSSMAAFCSNSDSVACLGSYVGSSAAQSIATAQGSFVSCAASYQNVSTSVNTFCLPRLLSAIGAAQSSAAIVGALCTANGNGTYCIPAFYQAQAVTTGVQGCATGLNALVSSLGCCLGTAQSLMNTIATTSTDPTLIPAVPGYTPAVVQSTVAPAAPTDAPLTVPSGDELSPNPGRGGFYALAACGVQGLNESLRLRCAQNRFSIQKNLLLKLDYAAATASTTVQQTIILGLRRDVAANAGVSPTQITSDSISSTSRVQVTTSSRALQVQTTANGVQYTYTISASSKAQAQAASTNIDTSVKQGYLPMSNTQAAVSSSCPACTGSGSAASVSQVSSTTIGNSVTTGGTPSSASSGAATVGTLLAIIITTLALLC